MKLEELDTLHRDCDQLVHRAQSLAAVDDIRPRIMKAASGFERLTEVTPDMFEDISDEELAKFDKFLVEMDEIVRKQNEILGEIQVSDTCPESQCRDSLRSLHRLATNYSWTLDGMIL